MKPTNPQIKIKCDECNGTGEITSGREEATGTEQCGKCDDGAIDAGYDDEGYCVGMYGSLFSEWGCEDHPADVAKMLVACSTQEDGDKLQAWFSANAAHCAALKADARKELCGKVAEEVRGMCAQAQSILAYAMEHKLPSKRLAQAVAMLGLIALDVAADRTVDQTIESHTLAESIDLHNLAAAAKQIGADKLESAAARAAIEIVEALKEVA